MRRKRENLFISSSNAVLFSIIVSKSYSLRDLEMIKPLHHLVKAVFIMDAVVTPAFWLILFGAKHTRVPRKYSKCGSGFDKCNYQAVPTAWRFWLSVGTSSLHVQRSSALDVKFSLELPLVWCIDNGLGLDRRIRLRNHKNCVIFESNLSRVARLFVVTRSTTVLNHGSHSFVYRFSTSGR